ncbi:unnamed protein product [Spirodela intermedia]|uniref:Uncharacterized protein n=1 Tax=Spirodela intermedia TaxID=51605 RepID=A0A7I8IJU0_SPIIN|nr:unnamed protein product [Spirodela intermedia]CAA6657639.1 unnamed protein product [Spirodela intermedia]
MAPAIVELGLVLVVLWTSGLQTEKEIPDARYIAVDELEEVNLFYYFVKSERSPAEDPFCPFTFDIKTYETRRLPSLIYREESWTRISSIIFVDSPVGTGFSYSKAAEENEWSDTKHQGWLVDHPEFISNPFYMAGDSYGGKLCPIVAQESFRRNHIAGNEAGAPALVNIMMRLLENFTGYLVGKPMTSEGRFDMGRRFHIPWGGATKASCGGDYVTPRMFNAPSVLRPSPEPKHSPEREKPGEVERPHPLSLQILRDRSSPLEICGQIMANSDAVRELLGSMRGDIRTNRTIDIPSAVPYHLNVTRRGFRALVYSGDHDLFVNFLDTSMAKISQLLHRPRLAPWLIHETYANNLTFATVKGAGHIATEYKPRECWDMFERWISGRLCDATGRLFSLELC